MSVSDPVSWTCRRYLRGCWKCRLRAVARWPRPYRHWGCGPARDMFPGVPALADLVEAGGEDEDDCRDL